MVSTREVRLKDEAHRVMGLLASVAAAMETDQLGGTLLMDQDGTKEERLGDDKGRRRRRQHRRRVWWPSLLNEEHVMFSLLFFLRWLIRRERIGMVWLPNWYTCHSRKYFRQEFCFIQYYSRKNTPFNFGQFLIKLLRKL